MRMSPQTLAPSQIYGMIVETYPAPLPGSSVIPLVRDIHAKSHTQSVDSSMNISQSSTRQSDSICCIEEIPLGAALIQLTQGYVAIVDTEDYEHLSQWKWYAIPKSKTCYAGRNTTRRNCTKRQVIRMHREVLNLHGIPFDQVDHINRNGLDNRLCNLRSATNQLNRLNTSLDRNNSSGYKGVYFHSRTKRWIARIGVKGQQKSLGGFGTPIEAALAYNKAALEIYGEYAWLNPIEGSE